MTEKKYLVFVVDHAHYMDEDGEYTRGEFENREEAETRCKEIIDRSLDELYTEGMNEEELFKQFMLYGEEASCDGFGSMEYVKMKCQELSMKK